MSSEVEEERRPLSFVAAAGWTIGAVLLLDVAVGFTEAARPGALGDLVSITACQVLAYSVVTFAMLRIYEPETPVREVVAFRAVPVWVIALASALAASAYPAFDMLDAFAERRFPPNADELELMGKLLGASSVAGRAFMAASFLVVTPIVDEVFFRGLVQGGLRRGRSALLAIVGSAVFFAGARADVRSFASVLSFGVVLGWLRDRSGSIVPTIAAQAAFFAVPVVPILRGRDPMADEVFPRVVVAAGVAIAVLCVAAIEAWSRRTRRG